MVAVGAEAVGPAIVELLAVGRHGTLRNGRGHGGRRGTAVSSSRGGQQRNRDRSNRRQHDGGVGAVVTPGEGSELAEALLVGLGKVELVPEEGPVVLIKVAPFFHSGGEDARFLEDAEAEANDGGLGDGFFASCGEALHFFDLRPEILDRIIWIPIRRKHGPIGL